MIFKGILEPILLGTIYVSAVSFLFLECGRLERKFNMSGIWRDKTMADKLMYIPNDDIQNYNFWKLKSVVETFKHLTL